jgi:hypothetical protein
MTNKLSTATLNVPKEIFIVTGGLSGSSKTEWDPLSDSFFSKRIPDTQKHYIATVQIWQTNKQYEKYVNADNYSTVYNEDNQTMYLCLHNNANFRDDLEPGLSTELPSHAFGRQTYSDGYTWLPLWKVDFTEWEFITPTEIPIPKIDIETDYTTFTEKYEPLCGTGVTAFGCCCLYFKENSVDELTGEVYSTGDVTNETIFSDCYECQKLADALGRDVLFLAGVTTGGVNSSHPSENPLCPATKTIKTLKENLEESKYTIVPGSSKDYQLFLLNNHNETGIMIASIDLSDLTDDQKSINTDNPQFTVTDPTGSDAVVRVNTVPIGLNKHLIYGIEIVSEGSGYGALPVVDASQTVLSTTLQARISVHSYPVDVYTNPQLYVKPQKLKISTLIYDSEIAGAIPSEIVHTKFAVMADPLLLGSQAPAVYTKNDQTTQQLTTKVTIYKPGTIVVAAPAATVPPNVYYLGDYPVNSRGYYGQYVVATNENSQYVYLNPARTQRADGYILYVNDESSSYTAEDTVTFAGQTYTVGPITTPTIDVKTGKFFNVTDISANPIGGITASYFNDISTGTLGPRVNTKATRFDVSINLI